ncbi:hypothetical protein [Tenacibaculum litopenaei]|uniref:hypothetical protein n=1 Tax=Tenacibaculum litopenaei TaxID=396016 RepID=UPI0038B6A75C
MITKASDNIEKSLVTYGLKENLPEASEGVSGNENVKFFFSADSPDAKHTGISTKYWNRKAVVSYGSFYNSGRGDARKGEI